MYSHSIGKLIHHWPQACKREDGYESKGELENRTAGLQGVRRGHGGGLVSSLKLWYWGRSAGEGVIWLTLPGHRISLRRWAGPEQRLWRNATYWLWPGSGTTSPPHPSWKLLQLIVLLPRVCAATVPPQTLHGSQKESPALSHLYRG